MTTDHACPDPQGDICTECAPTDVRDGLARALTPIMKSWGVRSGHGDWSDEETQRNAATNAADAALAHLAARPAVDVKALYALGIDAGADALGYSPLPETYIKTVRAAIDVVLAALTPDVTRPDDGASLIAAERRRQVTEEGWTPEHDAEHTSDDLAWAASCYVTPERGRLAVRWPWAVEFWKPTPDDRVRELVKAGALIAAEIDRLKALGVTR